MMIIYNKRQDGASMVEFLIVTPLLMFMGLGIMQFGLIYHAKSVLNYATFEAARTGAVMNGQIDHMRKELGYRMAPVFGGDGSLVYGVSAIARSAVMAQDITATKIEILNPTPASFELHGKSKEVEDSHGNKRSVVAIPNSHLRFRPNKIQDDGLNVQDANLLKIKVTYGYQMRLPFLDMEVPGVRFAMRTIMLHADPDNWSYYIRGQIPISSTATVRMQSEIWDSQLDPVAKRMFDALYKWILDEIDKRTEGENEDDTKEVVECDENGLPIDTELEIEESVVCDEHGNVIVPDDKDIVCAS